MKRTNFILLAALLCLSLAGCGAIPPPETAADGASWSENWVTVGGIVGVDTPDELTPRENNDALSANGMYYATWSVGEGESYTNEDGEDAELYDAQVYLLLGGCASEQETENTLTQWLGMANLQYNVAETTEESHNGQEFTVITYSFDSGSNPYARGASAFGRYRNYAVSVEVACQEEYDGEATQLLENFLDCCHYAMP